MFGFFFAGWLFIEQLLGSLHLIFTLMSDSVKLFWCKLYGYQSVLMIQRGWLYQNAQHGGYVDFPFDQQCLSLFAGNVTETHNADFFRMVCPDFKWIIRYTFYAQCRKLMSQWVVIAASHCYSCWRWWSDRFVSDSCKVITALIVVSPSSLLWWWRFLCNLVEISYDLVWVFLEWYMEECSLCLTFVLGKLIYLYCVTWCNSAENLWHMCAQNVRTLNCKAHHPIIVVVQKKVLIFQSKWYIILKLWG